MTNAFICFVSRDKEVADKLAAPLELGGVMVSPLRLRLGDRPVEKIKGGFSDADKGYLLLTPAFFRNPWPRSDLDALGMMAQSSPDFDLTIVWDDIDADIIASYSPMLASVTGRPIDAELTAESLADSMPSSKGVMPMFEQKGVMRGGRDGGVSDSAAVRDTLVNQFTESELRDMAFDLKVDYESYAGDTMNSKARQLVGDMRRQGRLNELVDQVEKRSQRAKW